MSIPPDTFKHYWNISRTEYKDVPYTMIKDAPIQSERSYYVGCFLNSSDGQITNQLITQLQQDMNLPIDIKFRAAPLDKKAQDRFWKEAYANANEGKGPVYQYAPLALTMYSNTAENSRAAAKYMMEKYGSQDEEGQYPRLPDGTRMRFIPAARFLDMAGKATAEALLANQIKFNAQDVKLALPITEINKKFDTHENRTTMELLLDMKCEQKGNEPYFRHICKRWTRDHTKKKYWVSVHHEMYRPALIIMQKLKTELTARYGEEVGNLVEDDTDSKNNNKIDTKSTQQSIQSESTLTIDTNDRYLNGQARFIIEGMEKLTTNEETPTLAEKRAAEYDNFTMEVESNGTNNTQESITARPTSEPPDHQTG